MAIKTRFGANESQVFRHKNGLDDDCSQSGADDGRLVLQKPEIAEAKYYSNLTMPITSIIIRAANKQFKECK